jgi:hypothetical protein
MVAPLCASTVVERVRWLLGWETEEIDATVMPMLRTRGRNRRYFD